MIFEKNRLLKKKVRFVRTAPSLQGPVWAHIGPYGPIWALMGPYGPEKSPKIHKKLAFINAFKVPCTLP